jgi:hypothetical protein
MTLSPTKTKNRIRWKRMEVGLACQKAEDKWLSFTPNAKYSFVKLIYFIP